MCSINDIWDSTDINYLKFALNKYWDFVKKKNICLERHLEQMDINIVEEMSPDEWYVFLYEKYFRWKFTALNRLAVTIKHLDKYKTENKIDELYEIKERLLSFDKYDIREGLKIATDRKSVV